MVGMTVYCITKVPTAMRVFLMISLPQETAIKEYIGMIISSTEAIWQRRKDEGEEGDKWSERKEEEKIGCWVEVD